MLTLLISLFLSTPIIKAEGYPVYRMLRDTTFRLYSTQGAGTGFVVKGASGKEYILTNWHVCQEAWNNKLDISSEAHSFTSTVEVVAELPEYDLCVLQSPIKIKALSVANIVIARTPAYTAGYPGYSKTIVTNSGRTEQEVITELSYHYRNGQCPKGFKQRVNLKEAECTLRILLQDTTIPAAPGCSGSPVVNSRGELIGVINSVTNYVYKGTTYRFGSMIPLRHVKQFLSTL